MFESEFRQSCVIPLPLRRTEFEAAALTVGRGGIPADTNSIHGQMSRMADRGENCLGDSSAGSERPARRGASPSRLHYRIFWEKE
jgi:hypothetical protein